jgi:hypothetical protein
MAEAYEGWPEYADDDANFVRVVFETGSELLKDVMDVLARWAPRRLTYEEVEIELGWNRGRLASVLGGYARRSHQDFGGRRPWHICPPATSSRGVWEIWTSRAQAGAIPASGRVCRSSGQ